MDKTHFFRMKIPLYEVDVGGGVYHGNYYHLFELARESLLADIGFPYKKIMEMGNHLTVAEAQCRYKKPLQYNDEIEIRSKIKKITSRSLVFDQEIWDNEDNELKTVLSIYLVCINNNGRAAIFPQKLKEALESWKNDKNNSKQ